MTSIRLMHEQDLEEVRWVDAAAFDAWWKKLKGAQADLPRRTHANVATLREKDPEGCFVAVDGGQVVGLIFSRTWGSVGWFGTFAVLPDCQGRGIGKRLMAASLDYLRRDPERVIGLSTMPESSSNLGLYLGQGFQVRYLTLMLTKRLQDRTIDVSELPHWSAVDANIHTQWLVHMREAAGRIRPGLDYTKEIVSTGRQYLGETLMFTREGRAIGMSIVRLRGIRESSSDESANVRVLMLDPMHTNEVTLRTLLHASEALARSHRKATITVAVNARHIWALDHVLRLGYRIERAALRMILGGTDRGPSVDSHVDLSRWAG